MRFLLTITLPLYLIDQLTKWLVLKHVGLFESIQVVEGFFYLVQAHNTGAAFSFMRGNNTFFITLAFLALTVLMYLWQKKGSFHDSVLSVGAALLAAGILGNLTDRLIHGHVVDFLFFILPVYGPWPVFNVADACICVSAVIFIGHSMLPMRRTPALSNEGAS